MLETTVLPFLARRLAPLEEARFAAFSHRRVPEMLKKRAEVAYFNVPLAAGTGAAVFAEPKGPPLAAGPRPLVILLHGLGDDCTFPHWHWMDLLLQKDLATLSLDWDGHGPGGASHLDFQAATRTLPLLLQKLFGENGKGLLPDTADGRPVFLMGHSTGAALALICASRPEVSQHVQGVIAVSPTVSVSASDYRSVERFSFANPSAWVRDFMGRVPYYGVRAMLPRPSGNRHEAFPLRVKVGLSLGDQLHGFLRETFGERRILRKVNVPVLWLHGAKDRFVPLADAQELLAEIPGALFAHVDRDRGHVRMAFSQAAPLYAARFIARCVESRNPSVSSLAPELAQGISQVPASFA